VWPPFLLYSKGGRKREEGGGGKKKKTAYDPSPFPSLPTGRREKDEKKNKSGPIFATSHKHSIKVEEISGEKKRGEGRGMEGLDELLFASFSVILLGGGGGS